MMVKYILHYILIIKLIMKLVKEMVIIHVNFINIKHGQSLICTDQISLKMIFIFKNKFMVDNKDENNNNNKDNDKNTTIALRKFIFLFQCISSISFHFISFDVHTLFVFKNNIYLHLIVFVL